MVAGDIHMYSASLVLKGRLCTVIGGGKVALCKVERLLEAGARVQVISPNVEPRLLELAQSGAIAYERRPYQAGDAARGFIVVAATDNRDVNRQIAQEAEQHERFVNVVDAPGECSFQLPASLTVGRLMVSISTQGTDPTAAKRLKHVLAKDLIEGTCDFPQAARLWIEHSEEGR